MLSSIFITLVIFGTIFISVGHGQASLWGALGVLYVLHFNNRDTQIDELKKEIAAIKKQLGISDKKTVATSQNVGATAKKTSEVKTTQSISTAIEPSLKVSTPVKASVQAKPVTKPVSSQSSQVSHKKTEADVSFFGQNLIIWLAGFAAILGAFYLIRYSVEHGFWGPKVRFALMTLFGLVMTYAGYIIYGMQDFANNRRIGQALTGAGLATLYFSAYAVSEIYHFTSQGVSLLWMCIVTGMAVLLTIIRGGKPIVLLTMLGAFLTPALAKDGYENPCFFSLYMLLFIGVFACLAAEMASVFILVLTALALYLWGFYWLFFRTADFISFWQMFLIIGATAFFSRSITKISNKNSDILQMIFIVFCFVFGFGYVVKMSLGLMEWAIIAMMTLGLIVLSFKDTKNYFMLFIGSVIVGLLIWLFSNGEKSLPVFAGYGAVCLLPIYSSLWIRVKPLFMAYLGVFSLAFYAVYCFVFHLGDVDTLVGLFGAIALLFLLFKKKLDTEEMQQAAGITLFSAVCLATIALAKLLSADMLPVLAAVCVFTFAGFSKLCRAKYMIVGGGLAFIWFVYLLLKPISYALGFVLIGQLFNMGISVFDLSSANIFCYGLIPLMLFSGAMVILPKGEARNVMFFSVCFLALGIIFALYAKTVTAFTGVSVYKPEFTIHAILTDLMIASYWLILKGRSGSVVLSGIGFWRLGLVFLVLLLKASGLPIGFTGALIGFGVPLGLFIWFSTLSKTESGFFAKCAMICSFYIVTLLVTISLSGGQTVRLFAHSISEGGVFAYSAGWMLLGICGLIASKFARFMVKPAFAMIYFVIAKVFLYDVAELGDFWRIISLFALAGCLFAIGHLHARCQRHLQQ